MYKFLISFGVVFLLLFVACGTNSDSQTQGQGISAQFRSQLSGAVKVYFELKDALVAADSKLAIEKAANLKTALSNIDVGELSGGLLTSWKKTLSDLQDKISVQISKENIEAQRTAFLPLSESIIKCAEDFGPFDTTVYVQHCPMAFNNKGGDWLSNSKEILNPYFGEMMPHCGSVKETIAQK